MWTTIYIAPNLSTANRIKEKLVAEGLLVNLKPVNPERTDNRGLIEILVPESEAEEAHEIIDQINVN